MTRSSRRHESLIPLSREHHYALMLCLRIRRGLRQHKEDAAWLALTARDAVSFFEGDLIPHFEAEEAVLFPAMREFSGTSELIRELLDEHRELGGLVEQLRRPEGVRLAGPLNGFADLLEAHIRREERSLFPIYEQQASPELARRVGQAITELIGSAAQPRRPELLK